MCFKYSTFVRTLYRRTHVHTHVNLQHFWGKLSFTLLFLLSVISRIHFSVTLFTTHTSHGIKPTIDFKCQQVQISSIDHIMLQVWDGSCLSFLSHKLTQPCAIDTCTTFFRSLSNSATRPEVFFKANS